MFSIEFPVCRNSLARHYIGHAIEPVRAHLGPVIMFHSGSQLRRRIERPCGAVLSRIADGIGIADIEFGSSPSSGRRIYIEDFQCIAHLSERTGIKHRSRTGFSGTGDEQDFITTTHHFIRLDPDRSTGAKRDKQRRYRSQTIFDISFHHLQLI